MGLRVITFVVILLSCHFSHGSHRFFGNYSDDIKNKFNQVKEQADRVLPESMKNLGQVGVAYSADADPVYYPIKSFKYEGEIKFVESVLVFNDGSDAMTAHEYAHFILDSYMRKNSQAWSYYITWARFGRKPLKEQVLNYQESLKTARRTYQDLKKRADEPAFKNFDYSRLENYITATTNDLRRIKRTLRKTRSFPVSLDKETMPVLEPYAELFADVVAVLATGEWDSVQKGVQADIENRDSAEINLPNVSPREDALKEYIDHRGFPTDELMEKFSYKDWQAEHPYTQFYPMRAYIRDLIEIEGYHPKVVIQALADAIIQSYEQEIIRGSHTELKSKNAALRYAVEGSLVFQVAGEAH